MKHIKQSVLVLAVAASLGAAGASGVRQHYTVERMTEQVEAVYREVAGARC